MKFKVTKKDLTMFIIYCIILLYFCAVAIDNFVSFSQDGRFAGIIPLRALTLDYVGYTFGLFIAALVLIFSSVSSYIFNKEKGLGIGLKISEKSSDGYSKWASEKDIKEDKGVEKINPGNDTIGAAGVTLINKGNEIWVDNGEYHNMIIGATGSGKTECIVKPLVNILSKKGESMVITDPKGEIYEYCGEYLRQQGYNIIILNFRDPQKGNAWNPLTLPYQFYKEGNVDKATELLEDVAKNILVEKNSNDPFWSESAADYFSGLALALFKDAKEEEVNLNSINYMSTVGEERRGTSNYIKDYFQLHGPESSEYIFASNTFNAPNETKGSILSTFRQKIRLFSTRESLSEMLSYSDFNMRDIGKQKTAVFMIIHDEKKTYHALMTIFTKQCYETLVDVAQKNGGKLQYRTNFILDEFANMPPINDVDAMVTAARSRAIRFTFIIQNFSQLDQTYGAEMAQTIRGNCGNLIYLISTELKALEEISKMCGEVKSKDKDKTASTPLVTVTDLQKMKLFQAIIIRWRKSPFKTQLTPDFKINWGNKYGKATLPEREAKTIAMFDLKQYVSEKKKNETFGGPGMMGNNPFMGGGNSFNPFGQQPSSPNPFMQNGPMPSPFGPSSPMANPFAQQTPKPNPFMSVPSSQSSINNPSSFGPLSNKDNSNSFGPMPNSDNQGSFSSSQNKSNPFMRPDALGNPFAKNDISKPLFDEPISAVSKPEATSPVPNFNNINPYANLSNKDIDEMVKDIERKLKELDEEEERKKKEAAKSKANDLDSGSKQMNFDDLFVENEKIEIPKIAEEKEEKIIEEKEPKIEEIIESKESEESKIPTYEEELVKSIIEKPLYDEKKHDTIEEAVKQLEKNEMLASKSTEEDLDYTQEIKLEEIQSQKVNIDNDSVVLNENIVTDDEFYDDFFDE